MVTLLSHSLFVVVGFKEIFKKYHTQISESHPVSAYLLTLVARKRFSLSVKHYSFHTSYATVLWSKVNRNHQNLIVLSSYLVDFWNKSSYTFAQPVCPSG